MGADILPFVRHDKASVWYLQARHDSALSDNTN